MDPSFQNHAFRDGEPPSPRKYAYVLRIGSASTPTRDFGECAKIRPTQISQSRQKDPFPVPHVTKQSTFVQLSRKVAPTSWSTAPLIVFGILILGRLGHDSLSQTNLFAGLFTFILCLLSFPIDGGCNTLLCSFFCSEIGGLGEYRSIEKPPVNENIALTMRNNNYST